MINRPVLLLIALAILGGWPSQAALAEAPSAQALVESCWNYMRGPASVSEMTMTIHRPDWERTLTIKAWTRGRSDSLFFITAPPQDKGNGTLKKGSKIWTYNPKVNRVIKLPPSMMSQSWMGSDFSNNDIAKSDTLIKDYDHEIVGKETIDDMTVYEVKSMPKPGAPVVWGMLKLKIREDGIMLEEGFYDEAFEPVKIMTMSDIQMLGGKLFPRVWQIEKADAENQYTKLIYQNLEFRDKLPDNIFTLSNLKNPRR